ncbi:MAG: tyrosine-protein phosphatase [Lactobacillus sp.]|uniref:Protein-tyrosine-phosphatase n=1 Tax=Bombilactobacillus bombi TaxID=1303590 RepID=A0A3R6Z9K3_9LACO|nr:tyrosine-protein phosphatase [Bombilactobacillus bombi]MCO6541737.1 tyrosine-protein phosphatase [Lactobacillus sp.]MCO6543304.1 tyrosine-protein phosphatase [Lactobacillus sp.]RHW47350.1 protein-tyrosine-phosphatase [Bombilactobacillus bombi]RHW50117.1 protein-tyrosine-phosphatase [Bombilactobacillus bombi]
MELTNFRDLGGMTTKDGKTIKAKALLRSGELVNLDTATQQELINNYHLTQAIDFRRDFEIQERPDDQLPGVKIINIDILKSANNNASLDDFIAIGATDKVDEHMMSIYHDLVLDKNAQAGYTQFLQLILQNNTGSTLFHCFAGKDRTGFGAALVLALLNVDEDQILQDYLQTNQDRKAANDVIIDYYRQQGAKQAALDAMAIALYVKPEYLQKALQLINDNYGDIYTYAQQALNFGAKEVQQLQAKLLE